MQQATKKYATEEAQRDTVPERVLWCAVIRQMLWDASRSMLDSKRPVTRHHTGSSLSENEVVKAREWLFGNYKADMAMTCDLAGIDKDTVKAAARRAMTRLMEYYAAELVDNPMPLRHRCKNDREYESAKCKHNSLAREIAVIKSYIA